MAKELLAAGIPVTLILDSGVGFIMEKVDMLLVGAEGVVESGGIINYIGTFQAALVARSMNKPVYVAAESYKVHLYRSVSSLSWPRAAVILHSCAMARWVSVALFVRLP